MIKVNYNYQKKSPRKKKKRTTKANLLIFSK